MTRLCPLFVVFGLIPPAAGRAQSSAASPPTVSPSAAVPPGSASPAAHVYEADHRRDPFLVPLSGGPEPRVVIKRGEGPAGYAVGEISVRGVMQGRGLLVAMIQGPDRRTYIVHSGDKLADGIVKSVTPQGLVIVQNISDPLSVQKQREVRKLLRSLEDTKE